MAADDEAIACDFCKRGRVTMRMEELALRQLIARSGLRRSLGRGFPARILQA